MYYYVSTSESLLLVLGYVHSFCAGILSYTNYFALFEAAVLLHKLGQPDK